MRTTCSASRNRYFALAAAVAAVLASSACGAGGGTTEKSGESPAASPQQFALGQAGPVQEYGQAKYKFQITPVKVVEGTHTDLKELDEPSKYEGKKVAWVYVKAKNVGATSAKDTLVMTNVGTATGANGYRGHLLAGLLLLQGPLEVDYLS
ncbi:hypothetical protein AB0J38_27810 [Streptomyces sp. NPDC050095]|uniref:hypothetical protein n=1 Tax=unclassified Streptomyces TaxID=2593676 RepID=UPI00343B85BA